jgi:hypothetical protein
MPKRRRLHIERRRTTSKLSMRLLAQRLATLADVAEYLNAQPQA